MVDKTKNLKVQGDFDDLFRKLDTTEKRIKDIDNIKIGSNLDAKSIKGLHNALELNQEVLEQNVKELDKEIDRFKDLEKHAWGLPKALRAELGVRREIARQRKKDAEEDLKYLEKKRRFLSDIDKKSKSFMGRLEDTRFGKGLMKMGQSVSEGGSSMMAGGGMMGMIGKFAKNPMALAAGAVLAPYAIGAYKGMEAYQYRAAQAPIRTRIQAMGLGMGQEDLTNLLTGAGQGSRYTDLGFGVNETLQQILMAQRQATPGMGALSVVGQAQRYGRAFGVDPQDIIGLSGAVRRGTGQNQYMKTFSDVLATALSNKIDKGKVPELLQSLGETIQRQSIFGTGGGTGAAELFKFLQNSDFFARDPKKAGDFINKMSSSMQEAANKPGSPEFAFHAQAINKMYPGANLNYLELRRVMQMGAMNQTKAGIQQSALPQYLKDKLLQANPTPSPVQLIEEGEGTVGQYFSKMGVGGLARERILEKMYGATGEEIGQVRQLLDKEGIDMADLTPQELQKKIDQVKGKDMSQLRIEAEQEAVTAVMGEKAYQTGQTIQTSMLDLQRRTLIPMMEGVEAIESMLRTQFGLDDRKASGNLGSMSASVIEDLATVINDPELFLKEMENIRTGKKTPKQVISQYDPSGYGLEQTLHAGAKNVKLSKKAVNPQELYNYIRSKGVSEEHAMGMINNFIHESGLRPGAWNPDDAGTGMPSGGLAQWHKGRLQRLIKFAGPNWRTDWKKQIDFMMTEPDTKDYLAQDFASAAEASKTFTTEWERPQFRHKKALTRLGTLGIFKDLEKKRQEQILQKYMGDQLPNMSTEPQDANMSSEENPLMMQMQMQNNEDMKEEQKKQTSLMEEDVRLKLINGSKIPTGSNTYPTYRLG